MKGSLALQGFLLFSSPFVAPFFSFWNLSVPYSYILITSRNFVNTFLSLYGTFSIDFLFGRCYSLIERKVIYVTQGERVKEVRKSLKMTLEEFGSKVGVAKQTISRIENGVNNLTDQMAKSICREYNVNYDWLLSGEGEMFSNLPQTVLDELCKQYELDSFDRSLVELYIELPDDFRQLLKKKMREMLLKEDGGK